MTSPHTPGHSEQQHVDLRSPEYRWKQQQNTLNSAVHLKTNTEQGGRLVLSVFMFKHFVLFRRFLTQVMSKKPSKILLLHVNNECLYSLACFMSLVLH